MGRAICVTVLVVVVNVAEQNVISKEQNVRSSIYTK